MPERGRSQAMVIQRNRSLSGLTNPPSFFGLFLAPSPEPHARRNGVGGDGKRSGTYYPEVEEPCGTIKSKKNKLLPHIWVKPYKQGSYAMKILLFCLNITV